MAKKDLETVSKHIDSIIKREKDKARGLLNRETHVYNVSYMSFKTELTRQLRSVRKFCPLTDSEYEAKIIALSKAFTKNLYESIEGSLGNKVNIGVNPQYPSEKPPDAFKATLSKTNHPSPFAAFQVARQGPISILKDSVVEELFNKFNLEQEYIDYTKMTDEELSRIKNDVGNKAKKVLAPVGSKLEMYEMLSSRIYGSTRAKYKGGPLIRIDGAVVRERGMSDLGHAKSVAVNKLILPIIAQKIIEGTIVEEVTKLGVRYNITSSVSMALKGTPTAKFFDIEVEVYDESSSQNRADGSRERKELAEKTEELKDLIFKEIRNNDWANQDSSPSFMKLVRSSILSSAVQIKGQNIIVKVDKSGIIPMKSSTPTTLTKNIKGSSSGPKVVASGKGSKVVPQVNTTRPSQSAPTQQKPNWLQLLPMINSRLTNTVAKNMGSPRLNFRTGRLAQSAKVVGVEQTPQGFPSFVFDYERDPYDVFDRTLGRSPWNTPQRDPRALVDQSVREIVREMAIGRFFTRRA